MSRAIVDAYFAAFNQRRWDAMVALCADDVVHDRNEAGREFGAANLRAYLELTGLCYEERLEALLVALPGQLQVRAQGRRAELAPRRVAIVDDVVGAQRDHRVPAALVEGREVGVDDGPAHGVTRRGGRLA